MTRVRVVGAGVSGLATAWRLTQAGRQVEVLEAGPEPGGLVGTSHTDHGRVERAAHAFVWTDVVERYFAELELVPEFADEASRRRYIFTRGRPRQWPLRVGETAMALARVAGVWLAGGLAARGEESLFDWAVRVAGPAAAERLVGPAFHGIYAASPHVLAARAVFGARRPGGRRRRLVAPAGGMGAFGARIAERLAARGGSIVLNAPVEALDPAIPTVVCTNAPSAATLVQPYAPGLAAALASVRMTTAVSVTAFYEPRPDDLRGFGVLFAPDAGVRALGVLFNSDAFPRGERWRSETWIYGGSGDETVPDEAGVPAAIEADRARLTGRRDPVVALYPTRWSPALPVYDTAVLDVVTRLGDLPPWLGLAGNALGRIGISHLLELADAAAGRVAAAA